MAEVQIQLFGGEQDGYRTSIDLRGEIPGMFFIWRAADNEVIALASGRKRVLLADKLAVLAYRLADEDSQTSTSELRYVRYAKADKKLPVL
jgi:hypothetical protein